MSYVRVIFQSLLLQPLIMEEGDTHLQGVAFAVRALEGVETLVEDVVMEEMTSEVRVSFQVNLGVVELEEALRVISELIKMEPETLVVKDKTDRSREILAAETKSEVKEMRNNILFCLVYS